MTTRKQRRQRKLTTDTIRFALENLFVQYYTNSAQRKNIRAKMRRLGINNIVGFNGDYDDRQFDLKWMYV